MLTALRVLNLIAWSAVLIMMAPAVWSIVRGQARAGDPYRLVFFAYALMAIGFSARWLVAASSNQAYVVLYLLSATVAVLTIKAAWSYGRGSRL